jgi:hypothetical protein
VNNESAFHESIAEYWFVMTLTPLLTVSVIFLVLSVLFFIAALAAIKKGRLSGTITSLVLAMLLLTLAALFGTFTIATQGYRALIHEEMAAVIKTEPTGNRTFRALFRFPDGREATFELAGDELYIDAHILKWKPIVNILGMHTYYELGRVAGRYADIGDERTKARTIFPLAHGKPLNMFSLRQQYPFLEPLVDAEYGSASFVTADSPAELELRISTTGLMIRKIPTI